MSALYLVPTPIGNLGDITYRAVEILGKADLVLAEDTRKTGILLRHLNISKPVRSHHQFNEHRTLDGIIRELLAGTSIALVTDAGTPGISDPGFLLVRKCIEAGIEIETLPGPTAFIPALVNSGLPSDRFVFEGFLPHKKGRQKRLGELLREPRTMVFYESPFRLCKTLQQLLETLGAERKASVSRELTKVHEETIRGTLAELVAHFGENAPRGEIVIVVEGAGRQ
ncbi:MAG TPA: 16S rRNA (cytidine(1402)-2'-O)-methyltransferase [Bacteroides sp.]|mgnify:CR=1 FL=1|nr:16S rRNA (cytidine(1402)-2'-O)-methyltransferase [Bacteroides sp.]